MAPPSLATRLQSLPPILHKPARKPMSSCSKGSRGLSVYPRVRGIFTPMSISPSLRSRQWGSRYAIRAGRNLPAKEFRYLRTVIVTAAVYRGTGQASDPIHRLATSQSPVFLVNSRYPRFSATPSSSGREVLHQRGHTFSRSYGVNLPSSLT